MSVVTGEEVLRNDLTSIRNGRDLGLRRLVINVIATQTARWRHTNIQSAVTSLFIIGSRRSLYSHDRREQGVVGAPTPLHHIYFIKEGIIDAIGYTSVVSINKQTIIVTI